MASGGLRWPDRPPIPRPRSASTSRAPCATGSSTGCSTGSGSPPNWPPTRTMLAGRRAQPDRRRRAGHRQLLLIEAAGQAGPVDLQGRHDGRGGAVDAVVLLGQHGFGRSSSASGSSSTARRSAAQTSAASAGVPGVLATSSTSRARMARHSGRAASPPPAAAACHGPGPAICGPRRRRAAGSPAGRGAGRRPVGHQPQVVAHRAFGRQMTQARGARGEHAGALGQLDAGMRLWSGASISPRGRIRCNCVSRKRTRLPAPGGRAAVRPVRSGKATGCLPAGFLSCSRNQARWCFRPACRHMAPQHRRQGTPTQIAA